MKESYLAHRTAVGHPRCSDDNRHTAVIHEAKPDTIRWLVLIAAGSLTDVDELQIRKGTLFIEDELLSKITVFGLRLSFR